MGCAPSHTADAFSPHEYAVINVVETTASVFSFLGSGLILLCYAVFPDLRKFAFKLIFFLSLSDLLASIAGFITPESNGQLNCGLCLMQAWLLSVFELSSVLWTACICHCLYQAVIHHDSHVARFERYYHLLSWGLPFMLALIPQWIGIYGFSGGWCWIVTSAPEWRFIQFYIPLWVVFGFNFGLYGLLFVRLRALMQSRGTDVAERKRDLTLFGRLGVYPVVLLVCWLWGSINRIHNSLDPEHPIFWLHVMHRFMGSSQGWMNCVAYGMNGSVRDKLSATLERLTGWQAARPSDADGVGLTDRGAAGGAEGDLGPSEDI